MVKPPIAGFAGRPKSGKSTACRLLMQTGYQSRAFADIPKKMVQMAFPDVTPEMLFGTSELRNTPLTSRPITKCPYCGSDTEVFDEDGLLYCVSTPFRDGCERQLPDFLTPRIILQTLATEWARTLDPDIWARAVLDTQEGATAISDVRFPNEVDFIRRRGGKVYFLLREYDEKVDRSKAHESERLGPEDCDVVIDNRDLNVKQFAQLLETYFPGVL